MSDTDKDNPFEEMQKQVEDMLKKANINFSSSSGHDDWPGPAEPLTPDPIEDGDSEEALKRIQSFNFKPREIKDYLDRFVVQQYEAKKALSVAICDHYNHVRRCMEQPDESEDYTKQNIILLGPTGVGKTYLIKTISKLIGVPFVKADATKFSETGYVGSDVDDLVRDLVKVAGGNTELAKYGIIYIDEIDKIASQTSSGGKDVSGRGVQVNLLKLMEETEVNLMSQTDMIGQMSAMMEMQKSGKQKPTTLNSKHILFIVSGAFMPMVDIIKKRIQHSPIGFGAENLKTAKDEHAYLKQVETTDFVQYGFEPEFIGRLPIRVSCDKLDHNDLESILTTAEGNILQQYRNDFKGYGINIDFLPDALKQIAHMAESENTGARGLMTVLERVLRDYKFELPSTPVEEFSISAETIARPEQALQNLLDSQKEKIKACMAAEVQEYAERFQSEHDLELLFEDDAIKALIALSLDSGKTVRSVCEERFRDFQFGLKLISQNKGCKSFTIPVEMVTSSEQLLSQWVQDSYKNKS